MTEKNTADPQEKVISILGNIKKAIISRHTQTDQGTYWHTSTMRLANIIENIPIWAMPWDEKQADDAEIDYERLKSISIPNTQFILALPNISGIPGVPNTEFLILCTPLDTNSLLFETLVDISVVRNEVNSIENLAKHAQISPQAAKEKLASPNCVGFHSAIIEIDRQEGEFYMAFNVLYTNCKDKKEEIMLQQYPAYEPFTKCSTCNSFDDIIQRSEKCYLHLMNAYAIAHVIVKALQRRQQHNGPRP